MVELRLLSATAQEIRESPELQAILRTFASNSDGNGGVGVLKGDTPVSSNQTAVEPGALPKTSRRTYRLGPRTLSIATL